MRPNVRIALDCWDGDAAAAVYTPAQLQEARTDADVIRVYPRMKDFEQVRAVQCSAVQCSALPLAAPSLSAH